MRPAIIMITLYHYRTREGARRRGGGRRTRVEDTVLGNQLPPASSTRPFTTLRSRRESETNRIPRIFPRSSLWRVQITSPLDLNSLNSNCTGVLLGTCRPARTRTPDSERLMETTGVATGDPSEVIVAESRMSALGAGRSIDGGTVRSGIRSRFANPTPGPRPGQQERDIWSSRHAERLRRLFASPALVQTAYKRRTLKDPITGQQGRTT